jgi:NAD(P)-dependent dehydrogenase (short-subunit alcohol dehydrogenase family)
MARIFITGSADGLGLLAAKRLEGEGHKVVLHARNELRAKQAFSKLPGAENVLTGDLSSMEETKQLANKVNASGRFDAIIHNAGVYTESNTTIFAVNTLAPYILTCMIEKPERLVYMSSGLHLQGDPGLKNISDGKGCTYSDSKLHMVILTLAVAGKWQNVYANAVDPGWVPTKMGGPGAPGSLDKGAETQAWLAVSNDEDAKVSGHYFHHKKQQKFLPAAADVSLQEKFMSICEKISGIKFPA